MELSEIKEKEKELRDIIFNSITKFENETKTHVVSVDLLRHSYMGGTEELIDTHLEVRI